MHTKLESSWKNVSAHITHTSHTHHTHTHHTHTHHTHITHTQITHTHIASEALQAVRTRRPLIINNQRNVWEEQSGYILFMPILPRLLRRDISLVFERDISLLSSKERYLYCLLRRDISIVF